MRKQIEIEKELTGIVTRIAEIHPKQAEADTAMREIEREYASGRSTIEQYQHVFAAKNLNDMTICSLRTRETELRDELTEITAINRRKGLIAKLQQIAKTFQAHTVAYFETRQKISDAAEESVAAHTKLKDDRAEVMAAVQEILPEVSNLGRSPAEGFKNYGKLDDLFAEAGIDADIVREIRGIADLSAPAVEYSQTADTAITEIGRKAQLRYIDDRATRERENAVRREALRAADAKHAANSETYLQHGTSPITRPRKNVPAEH